MAFYLMHQDIATPAMHRGLADVPFAPLRIGNLIQNTDVMSPRDLCNSLLHKLFVGIILREGSHILEVAWRKTTHFKEGHSQIMRKAIDDFCSPTSFLLTNMDTVADLPVEQNRFTIDGQSRTNLRGADALPQVLEEGVVFRERHQIIHGGLDFGKYLLAAAVELVLRDDAFV